MGQSASSGEDTAKTPEQKPDEPDPAHPGIVFAAEDRAFLDCDLDEAFGEQPGEKQETLQDWLIERALAIVEAEMRPGETMLDLYNRSEGIPSPLVQRACEILDRIGLFDDQEGKEDPVVEGPGRIPSPARSGGRGGRLTRDRPGRDLCLGRPLAAETRPASFEPSSLGENIRWSG
jgi:hypothetical protein